MKKKSIFIRCTEEEKDQIVKQSRLKRQSISSYVLYKVLKGAKK